MTESTEARRIDYEKLTMSQDHASHYVIVLNTVSDQVGRLVDLLVSLCELDAAKLVIEARACLKAKARNIEQQIITEQTAQAVTPRMPSRQHHEVRNP